VTLPGGDLVIGWREGDDHILMTGPFALDYQGTLPPELLQQAPAASS
jgi:diaminopimelate epimerase